MKGPELRSAFDAARGIHLDLPDHLVDALAQKRRRDDAAEKRRKREKRRRAQSRKANR